MIDGAGHCLASSVIVATITQKIKSLDSWIFYFCRLLGRTPNPYNAHFMHGDAPLRGADFLILGFIDSARFCKLEVSEDFSILGIWVLLQVSIFKKLKKLWLKEALQAA